MVILNEAGIFLDIQPRSSKEAIYLLAGALEKLGAVSSKYAEIAYKREQKYPTGLPAQPYPIALPHTNCEEVYQPALAFARLKEPVFFGSMENHSIDLPVSMVLLMANNKPQDQIRMLRRISKLVKNPKNVIDLFALNEVHEVTEWLKRELKLNPVVSF